MSTFLKNGKIDFKMGETKMSVEKRPLINNSKITSVMITSTQSYDKVAKGDANIEKLNYSNMRNFVEQNINKFVGQNKNIQINILTDQGWRGGEAFTSDKFSAESWYMRENAYAGDASSHIQKTDSIFAVQILVF